MADVQDRSAISDRIRSLKQKRKAKKKLRKRRKIEESQNKHVDENTEPYNDDDTQIEYVVATPSELDHGTWQEFAGVFERFRISEVQPPVKEEETTTTTISEREAAGDDLIQHTEPTESPAEAPISKKKLKRLTQLSVEELKQLADVPEVVEPWDVTAADPKLLIDIKSYRNTVPVPVHWYWKPGYRQRKRGLEKPPWNLPEFIKQTGISELRDAAKEKAAAARGRAKRRARLNPKLGKMDVDYQKLYDAFFKFQTKPKLTRHGDIYFEGKAHIDRLKEKFKPGQLSDEIREALQMQPGDPPPWLFSMQLHGPPPGYPNLTIPGVNAPIPEGAQWGFHRGGWGRPPVDEFNRPLYGDLFGQPQNMQSIVHEQTKDIDRTLWGELEPEVDEITEEEAVSETELSVSSTESDEQEEEEHFEQDVDLSCIELPTTIELRKTLSRDPGNA